jgi:ribosome-binding protein aMBF1 (putative translation factor)
MHARALHELVHRQWMAIGGLELGDEPLAPRWATWRAHGLHHPDGLQRAASATFMRACLSSNRWAVERNAATRHAGGRVTHAVLHHRPTAFLPGADTARGAEHMSGLADRFATNLKVERLRRKLSQEALAAKAGLSVSYISMLERGQRTPPLDTLESIAKALAVNASTLLQ